MKKEIRLSARGGTFSDNTVTLSQALIYLPLHRLGLYHCYSTANRDDNEHFKARHLCSLLAQDKKGKSVRLPAIFFTLHRRPSLKHGASFFPPRNGCTHTAGEMCAHAVCMYVYMIIPVCVYVCVCLYLFSPLLQPPVKHGAFLGLLLPPAMTHAQTKSRRCSKKDPLGAQRTCLEGLLAFIRQNQMGHLAGE